MPALRAAASSGRIKPAPALISESLGSAGWPVWTIGHSSTEICMVRSTEAPISWPMLFGRRSMTLTPWARRNSNVGTLLSAKARMISRSL